MPRKSPLRTANERPIFCTEVILDGSRPPTWVDLVLSIAGRESVFTRRWHLHNGMLDASTATDISGTVEKSILDAVTMMCGVQTELPLS